MPPAFNAAASAARIAHAEPQRGEPGACVEISGGSTPKWLRKADGSMTWISPRGVDAVTPLDVAMQIPHAGERRQEDVMVRRIFGHQHRARNRVRRIGVALESRFQKFSGKCCWQVAKPVTGALASRANASEKPTLTAVPSGLLPARSNCRSRRKPKCRRT